MRIAVSSAWARSAPVAYWRDQGPVRGRSASGVPARRPASGVYQRRLDDCAAHLQPAPRSMFNPAPRVGHGAIMHVLEADACFAPVRYDLLIDDTQPPPPVMSTEDLAWIDKRLRATGARPV